MVKFVKTSVKTGLSMFQINDGQKNTWYNCEQKVYSYAKSIKEGEEIELVTEQRDNKPFVVQIKRVGQASTQSAPATQANAPVATQSQAKPTYTPKYESKSPDVQALIVKQSTMASAANVVTALTGQITDPNVLLDTLLMFYNKMLAEINK